jgi:hypothetical protein
MENYQKTEKQKINLYIWHNQERSKLLLSQTIYHTEKYVFSD